MRKVIFLSLFSLLAVGCGEEAAESPAPTPSIEEDEIPEGGEELPLGEFQNDKEDGVWGAATTCKELPPIEPLASPAIVVSLDGATLRLYDREGDYDQTFRTGVGSINNQGVSLTPVSDNAPEGVFYARADRQVINDTAEVGRWAYNQGCRIWWKDPDSGRKIPVFAGLPWIRLEGPPTLGYGMHGPIDNFTQPSGGTLRQGFVSHGCMRLGADDIKEVWRRIQGHKVPVRVQKAVERREDGSAVRVKENWLLTQCTLDSECRFEGGFCKRNAFSDRGFCSTRCEQFCPDKAGQPTSFCVADEEAEGKGYCTLRADATNNACRRYDHQVLAPSTPRFGGTGAADACLPGTEGWIGDRCLGNDDCETGSCTPLDGGPAGICTQACDGMCSDKDGGYAMTFCVSAPASVPDEGGICVAQCDTNDDCPVGTACKEATRATDPNVTRTVCAPTE